MPRAPGRLGVARSHSSFWVKITSGRMDRLRELRKHPKNPRQTCARHFNLPEQRDSKHFRRPSEKAGQGRRSRSSCAGQNKDGLRACLSAPPLLRPVQNSEVSLGPAEQNTIQGLENSTRCQTSNAPFERTGSLPGAETGARASRRSFSVTTDTPGELDEHHLHSLWGVQGAS